MAGRVMRLLDRTQFDFAKIQGGQSQRVWIARGIDVSQFKEATVYIRSHAGTGFAGGAGTPTTCDLEFYHDGSTAEDPAALTSLNAAAFMKILASGTTDIKALSSSGTMVVATFPANIGAMWAIAINYAQPASALTTANLVVSIDVALKE